MPFTLLVEPIADRTDWPRYLYLLKEALKAKGWRIPGSGDGVATFLNGAPDGTDRDVITHGGSGAGGMYNPDGTGTRSGCHGPWFRLQTPADAEVQKEFLFWEGRNAGRGEEWRIEITFDAAGFQTAGVLGPPTNRIAPEAVNHVTLSGSQTRPDNSAEWRTFATAQVNYFSAFIVGDASERYAFFSFTFDNNSLDYMRMCFGMDPLVGCHDSDFDKFAYVMGHQPSTGASSPRNWMETSQFWRGDSGSQELDKLGASTNVGAIYVMRGPDWPFTDAIQGAYQQAWVTPHGFDGFGTVRVDFNRRDDDITARFDSFRFWLDNNSPDITIPATAKFSKGTSYGGMIRHAPIHLEKDGPLYEDEDGKTWMPMGQAMLAWPSATLPDLGTGTSTPATTGLQIRNHEDVASGPTGSAPVVVFEDPLPGTPISPTQTITLTVTDPDGEPDILLLVVSASFASDEDEVIFRDGVFRPTYSGSTITPIANGNRFVISRNGAWPAEVSIDADVADSGGNLT